MEGIRRVRSGTVPNTGASVLVELEYAMLPARECFHQQGSLSEPYTLGTFTKPSSCRNDQLLTQFPAPLPSPENRRTDQKVQASNHSLVCLVTNPLQDPLKTTLLEQKTLLPTGEITSLGSSVSRTRGRDQHIFISCYFTKGLSQSHFH